MGASDPLPIDVRFIAAMNRNVHDLVAGGRFREDLFYRLNVIEIPVPALRDRDGDIRLLALHYVAHYARVLNKPAKGFIEPVLNRLDTYRWPGNVRELQNVVERMVNFSDDELIGHGLELPNIERRNEPLEGAAPPPKAMTLAELESDAIQHALFASRHNVTRAAEMLGVTKPRMYRMIRRHGIKLERTKR